MAGKKKSKKVDPKVDKAREFLEKNEKKLSKLKGQKKFAKQSELLAKEGFGYEIIQKAIG